MTDVILADVEEAQRWNAGPQDKIQGDDLVSSTDATAISADVAVLDALDPAARELAVTQMLDQSRQWLDRAMESTNPARAVSEFKAFVATVAEAAKQKKLSEGIQLDAIEMVRRSERALGVAIREGQARGTVLSKGEGGGPGGDYQRGAQTVHVDPVRESNMISPKQFFAHGTDAVQTYAVTDGVSNEEYDLALSVARDEKNLWKDQNQQSAAA